MQTITDNHQQRFYQTQDEYKQFIASNPDLDGKVSLGDYAKAADRVDAANRGGEFIPHRQAAYEGESFWKNLAGAEERFVDPISQYTAPAGEYVGGLADKVFGTNGRIASVGRELGQTLPVDLAEQTAFGISDLLSAGGSAPVHAVKGVATAGKYANMLKKAIGIGAMANTGMRTYAQTDSLGQGAVSAGMLPISNWLIGKGAGKAMGAAEAKFGSKVANLETLRVPGDAEATAANVVAQGKLGGKALIGAASAGGALGGMAGNELQHQLSGTVTDMENGYDWKNHDPFTVENIAGNIIGGTFGAELPRLAMGIKDRVSLNPNFMERYSKHISNLQDLSTQYNNMVASGVSNGDAIKNSVAAINGLSDLNAKNAEIAKNAQVLAAKINGPEGLEFSRDQGLIKYIKENPIQDDADFQSRIGALTAVRDKLFSTLDANSLLAGKKAAGVEMDINTPDAKSGWIGGQAAKQLSDLGYIDLSEQAIDKMLTIKQKEALSDSSPAEVQQKVIRQIADQLEGSFKEAHARFLTDMMQKDPTQFDVTDFGKAQKAAAEGDELGVDARSRKQAFYKAQNDNIRFQDSMRSALTALDEVKGIKVQMGDAAAGTPDLNLFQGHALENVHPMDEQYKISETRGTVPTKMTLDAMFSEAVNHITHFDTKYDAQRKVGQFADDFAHIWNGIKDEAKTTGVIPWDKKVEIPASSIWMKNADEGGKIQMSLADLFHTSGDETGNKNYYTNPLRKFKQDEYVSRKVEGARVGEEDNSPDIENDLAGAEHYVPGEYESGYENLRKRIWSDVLGEDFDHVTPDEQEVRIERAQQAVANVEKVKGKLNLAEFDAPTGKNQSEHNSELWKKYAGVFLKAEEGGKLKPNAARANMFATQGHLLAKAMLDWGPLADESKGAGTSSTKGIKDLPGSVVKFMDSYDPTWREKKTSPYAQVTQTFRNIFRETGYNPAYEKLVRLHTGTEEPAVIRESKTRPTSGKKPKIDWNNYNASGDVNKFLGDAQKLTVGSAVGEPMMAVYEGNDTHYSAPNRVYSIVVDHGLKAGVGEDMAHLYATLAAKAVGNLGSEANGLKVYNYRVDDGVFDKLPVMQRAMVVGKLIQDSDVRGVFDQHTKSMGIASNPYGVPNTAFRMFDMQSVVGTVLHELMHYTEKQALGQMDYDHTNPFAAERVLSMQKAMDTAALLDPSVRKTMLEHVANFSMPYLQDENTSHEIRSAVADMIKYGVSKENEFLTTMAQFLGQGFLHDGDRQRVTPEHIYSFMPNEIAMYMKGYVRDAKYNLEALKAAKPEMAGHLEKLVNNLDTIVKGENVRVAEKEFNHILQTLSNGGSLDKFVPDMTTFSHPVFGDISKSLGVDVQQFDYAKRKQISLFKTYATMLNGEKPSEYVKLNWYQRNFVPFMQVMDEVHKSGLKLARDIADQFSSFAPQRNNMMTLLYNAVLTRDPRTNGMRLMQDPSGGLAGFIKIQQETRGAKAVNAIHNWEQTNNTVGKAGQPAEVLVQMGANPQTGATQFSVNPKYQQIFDGFTQGFSSTEKSHIIEAVGRNKLMCQQAGGVLVETQLDSTAHRLAQIGLTAMRHDADKTPPMGWKDVLATTKAVVTAAYHNDIPRMDAILQKFNAWPELAENFKGHLLGKDPNDPKSQNLIEKLRAMKSTMLRDSMWYAPQQRHGRYLLMSKDLTGQVYVDGAENLTIAKRMEKELGAKGYQEVKIVDKMDKQAKVSFQTYDRQAEQMMNLVDEGFDMFLDENPTGLDPKQVDALRSAYNPSDRVWTEMKKKSIDRYFLERKGVPAAMGHDYIKYVHHYLTSVAESASRKNLVNNTRTALLDYTAINQDKFRNVVNGHLEGVLAPNPEGWRTVKALTSAYYLALNLSSMAIEGVQTLQTLVPTMIRAWDSKTQKGSSVLGTYQTYISALGEAARFSRIGSMIKDPELAARENLINKKLMQGVKLTPEEERILYFQKAFKEGELTHSAISEDSFANDQRAVINNAFSQGGEDKGPWQLLTDKGYWAADHAMKVYRLASSFNNKVSLLAGLMDGQQKGLTGNELYQHARNLKHLAMFDGGKMNQPMYINNFSSTNTRAAWSAYHTLQQYSMASLAHYVQMTKEAIPESVGGAKVPAGVRMQARKALGISLMTQITMAGVMGLPLVGAAMTMAENTTGVDSEQAMREFFATLGKFTPFEEEFADVMSNGYLNYKTGIDFGSRMGAGNLAGMSYYNGFSLKDLAGPIPGVIEQLYKASGYAQQKDFPKALHTLLPNGLKGAAERIITQSRFGDTAVRDASNRMVWQPSAAQNAAMYIGFKPAEMNIKSNLNRRIVDARTSAKASEDTKSDQLAAEYARGNILPAREYAMELMRKEGSPQTFFSTMKAINDRVTQMQTIRDFTQGQTRSSAQREQQIFSTYRPDIVRGSTDFERSLVGMKNAASGGIPVDGNSIGKSVLMDQFMSQGMSRYEAERLAGLAGY